MLTLFTLTKTGNHMHDCINYGIIEQFTGEWTLGHRYLLMQYKPVFVTENQVLWL